MILPKDARPLGTQSDGLAVTGSGSHTAVLLDGQSQRDLSACLGCSTAGESPVRICLAVENVRGSHDASVLNFYLNLHEDGASDESLHLQAGSMALYGLRRASSQGGEGLDRVFDITAILRGLHAAGSLDPAKIKIDIVPYRPLPAGTDIVVGRLSLFMTSRSG